MSLAAGTKLGPYEIESLLGAGGMGEVYRARDMRLKRDVAIKVLPDAFASDPERLARFQREAELLATLNHPNIGAVYGLEQTSDTSAIVLELIEGETLADRIARGALPIKTALIIALQIAEALEAAHERGVVHRDLKPANIKITADDKVKVLDFGLAKALEANGAGATAGGAVTHSPTLSMMATQAGMILGTAAYMSPEQAKGFPADQRSDIFSFGTVLYEMLTGRQPFHGDTAPDVLASVIVREVDFNALPPNLNPRVRELIERCLEKNPKKRWQAIGDARAELETLAAHPLSVATAAPVPLMSWRRVVPIAATALLTAVGAVVVDRSIRPAPAVPNIARFSMALAEGQTFTNTGRPLIAISPDGRQIAFVANQMLFLRSLSEFTAQPITGTRVSPGGVGYPAFSPDGRYLVFWSGGDLTLKRIPVTGGAAVTICAADAPFGISWDEDGIVYGQGAKGIMRVRAEGGKPELLVTVKPGEVAHGPQLLPGAKTVLFTLASGVAGDRWETAQLVAQSLQSEERKTLVEGGADGRYVRTGHIVYAVGGTLFAVSFDPIRLMVTGAPTPVLEGVRRVVSGTGTAQISISQSGVLAYLPGPAFTSAIQRQLAFLDSKGNIAPLDLPAGSYVMPRVSPNGKQLAFGTEGKEEAIWIYDLSGVSSMRRLAFGGRNRFPMWSADSQRVAFQSDREGDLGIFWQRADGNGPPERLTKADQGISHIPEVWFPGGDRFAFTEMKGSNFRLWTYSVKDRTAAPYDAIQASQPITPVFSPDGRWLAYTSTETGRVEVFVQPFPSNGTKYQISANGGHHALWTPDGKSLLWDVTSGISEIVTVNTKPVFTFGSPAVLPRGTMLFAGNESLRPVDMAPDGRILGAILVSEGPSGTGTPSEIRVVLNWFEELKQRVPLN